MLGVLGVVGVLGVLGVVGVLGVAGAEGVSSVSGALGALSSVGGVSSGGGKGVFTELSVSGVGFCTSSLPLQAKMVGSKDSASNNAAIDFNFFILTSLWFPSPQEVRRGEREDVISCRNRIGSL